MNGSRTLGQTTIWETTWTESAALTAYDWFNTTRTVWKSCWLSIIYLWSQRWATKSYKQRPPALQWSLPSLFSEAAPHSSAPQRHSFGRLIAGSPLRQEPRQENTAERNGPGRWEVQPGPFLTEKYIVSCTLSMSDWRWRMRMKHSHTDRAVAVRTNCLLCLYIHPFQNNKLILFSFAVTSWSFL